MPSPTAPALPESATSINADAPVAALSQQSIVTSSSIASPASTPASQATPTGALRLHLKLPAQAPIPAEHVAPEAPAPFRFTMPSPNESAQPSLKLKFTQGPATTPAVPELLPAAPVQTSYAQPSAQAPAHQPLRVTLQPQIVRSAIAAPTVPNQHEMKHEAAPLASGSTRVSMPFTAPSPAAPFPTVFLPSAPAAPTHYPMQGPISCPASVPVRYPAPASYPAPAPRHVASYAQAPSAPAPPVPVPVRHTTAPSPSTLQFTDSSPIFGPNCRALGESRWLLQRYPFDTNLPQLTPDATVTDGTFAVTLHKDESKSLGLNVSEALRVCARFTGTEL